MKDTKEYVGLWQRLGAALIDGLLFLPVLIIYMKLHKSIFSKSLLAYLLYLFVLYGVTVFFIVRFGGTPGKLILKYRITSDGDRISVFRALLRNIFPIASSILLVMSNYLVSDISLKSNLSSAADILGVVYVLDVLVIPFNKQKRALHDFIANTYVVRKG